MSGIIPRIVEWIAGSDGAGGAKLRLGLVVAGLFLWAFFKNWRSGGLEAGWWMGPLLSSGLLVSAYGLWRLIERRRRAARVREKAVRRIDLA